MGKKSRSQSDSKSAQPAASLPFLGGGGSVDPALASLFEQSAGPVKQPSVPKPTKAAKAPAEEPEDEQLSEPSEDLDDELMQDGPDASGNEDSEDAQVSQEPSRKRKRGGATEDIEESYMRRLAKEEQQAAEKDRAEKAKRPKVDKEEDASSSSASEQEDEDEDEDAESSDEGSHDAIPKHESQEKGQASSDLDKSARTVFLGNVSTDAIKSKSGKKALLKHLSSFLSSLPESSGPHTVESLRFRSTAFASGGRIPKRAAFARRDVLDETTPSTNAYAVYSTIQAARKAPAALNGTIVLNRHLRVDSVAHPAKTDHKRCIFVGNLDFIDKDTAPEEDERKHRKKMNRAPADIEEGLWRTFNSHTTGPKDQRSRVESVRVIRDGATRVGKGFAYVQFYDPNCVEEALLLDGKQYPPMLPRKLRVTRARKMPKKRDNDTRPGTQQTEGDRTLQGRAGKLFGRAGAAKVRADGKKSISANSLVFEGNRATEDGGARIRVKTKSRGSKGKPNNRSSKRAAAYKAAGGRKGKMGTK